MAWWIIAGVLALLLLLSFVPVTVCLHYRSYEQDALTVRLRWPFLGRTVHPEKPKKPNPKRDARDAEKAKKKAEKKAAKKAERDAKKKGKPPKTGRLGWEDIRNLWDVFRPVLRSARRNVAFIGRHSRLTHVVVLASIGGGNAALAGENSGRFCAFFYPLLGVIRQFIPMAPPYIRITPNYIAPENVHEIAFQLKIIPIVVCTGGARLILRLLRAFLAYTNNKQKHKPNTSKGGNVNEPTQPQAASAE